MPAFTGREGKTYYKTINLTDWSGGLNTSSSPSNISDNELSVAENVIISSRGQIKKRKGLRLMSPMDLTSISGLSYGDGVISGTLKQIGD